MPNITTSYGSSVAIRYPDGAPITYLFYRYQPYDGSIQFAENRSTITLQSDGANWYMIASNYMYYIDTR